MKFDALLARLDGVKPRGNGRYSARCPAHTDKSPSLSVSEGERGILLRCWTGCSLVEICASLGIAQPDLFFDKRDATPQQRGHRPIPRPVKIDLTALAFRYDLAALDRRLRADSVLKAATHFSMEGLDDRQLDRLMEAVASGYTDIARAELFEGLADDVREKAFARKEGTVNDAAHH